MRQALVALVALTLGASQPHPPSRVTWHLTLDGRTIPIGPQPREFYRDAHWRCAYGPVSTARGRHYRAVACHAVGGASHVNIEASCPRGEAAKAYIGSPSGNHTIRLWCEAP